MIIFSSPENNPTVNSSERIAAAAEGLVYISETDADITPFSGEKCDSVTSQAVLDLQLGAKQAPIEEMSPEEFFARLTQMKDWFGTREKNRARRFAELYSVLSEELRDLHVFRVGRIQIDIYIVGIGSDGRLSGVWTRAVET
jgi:Nuclease A inhibitor-like protein